ncbi:MAG: META domain-containing protein [Rhodothermales bacterium]
MTCRLLFASALLTITGCGLLGDKGAPAPEPSSYLEGTEWRLASTEGVGAPPPTEARYAIHFIEAGAVAAGRIQCNGWGGSYSEYVGGRISIDVQAIELAGCPNPAPFDDEYPDILEAAQHYELEDSTLVLHTDAERGQVLHFVRIRP